MKIGTYQIKTDKITGLYAVYNYGYFIGTAESVEEAKAAIWKRELAK